MNRHYILTLIILFVVSFSFAGCHKEDSIFSGDEMSVVEFSLTQNGVKYSAAIEGNNITVTVPTTVNMSGAEASYALSEHAELLPDPSTVTAWEEEQVFRVQSQNKKWNTFTYHVRHSDLAIDGNVVLSTQKDVDAFADKKINAISGNLIIGSSASGQEDPVTNLSMLKSLTSVRYNIVINSSFAGTDLDGLSNITKANGIYIGDKSKEIKTARAFTANFANLTNVGTVFINCDSLKTLSMPKLTAADELYINAQNLASADFTAFEECGGDMYLSGIIGNSVTEKTSNLALNSLDFPALKKVDGSFTIYNFWGLKKLNLKSLTEVTGALNFKYIRYIPTISMPALTKVGGKCNIEANDGMKTFSAPALKGAASFYLASVNIYSMHLKYIELDSFENSDGDFTIKFAGAQSISLPKLTKVGGKLTLDYMTLVEAIKNPSLEKCKNFELMGNQVLKEYSLGKLDSLQALNVSGLNSLNTLSAPELVYAKTVSIKGVYSLENLNLSKLNKVDGNFTFYGGNAYYDASKSVIKNLNGLSSLTNAGRIEVRFASKLVDFSGLKNVIPNITASNWAVGGCGYNPSYQDMVNGKYTNN